VGVVLVASGIAWLVGAALVQGTPKVQGSLEELAAIEHELELV
jgi:hypothetical protein